MALALVALLALLAYGALSLGGDGGNQAGQAGQAGQDDRGDGAASSITPGPTSSEPVDNERPGGRDEVEEDDDAGDADGSDGDADSAGQDGSGDSGSGDGASDDSKSSGGSSGGAGDNVDGLATCRAGQAKVSLESVKNEYAPGELPKLRITVENTSGTDCGTNITPDHAVLTVVDEDDETVWASDHCVTQDTTQLRVPARGERTHTVSWDRERSAASCATPPGGAPGAGTYLVEIEIPQLGTAQSSFVLAKD